MSKKTRPELTMASESEAEAGHVNLDLNADSITAIAMAVKDTIFQQLQVSMGIMVEAVVRGVADSLTTRVTVLEKTNALLCEENKLLLERVQHLEGLAETSEQYSRRNCLRISGVKESIGEDTDAVMMGIFDDMHSGVVLSDVDRSHRIGKPKSGGKGREIIVKFATYRARQKVIRKRTILKTCGHTGVYVNEDLTKYRAELLYEARQLVKAKKIAGAWSSDGTILIKTVIGETTTIHRIQKRDDLTPFNQPVNME
ncbi:MAG: hypothetical protein ABW185_00995 [Sedimenticola sp.]